MSASKDTLLAGVDEVTAAKIRELAAPIIIEMGVSLSAMLGKSHMSRIVRARHRLFTAMYRLGFSHSEIGQVIGRNHTAVRSGESSRRWVLLNTRPRSLNGRWAERRWPHEPGRGARREAPRRWRRRDGGRACRA